MLLAVKVSVAVLTRLVEKDLIIPVWNERDALWIMLISLNEDMMFPVVNDRLAEAILESVNDRTLPVKNPRLADVINDLAMVLPMPEVNVRLALWTIFAIGDTP